MFVNIFNLEIDLWLEKRIATNTIHPVSQQGAWSILVYEHRSKLPGFGFMDKT